MLPTRSLTSTMGFNLQTAENRRANIHQSNMGNRFKMCIRRSNRHYRILLMSHSSGNMTSPQNNKLEYSAIEAASWEFDLLEHGRSSEVL